MTMYTFPRFITQEQVMYLNTTFITEDQEVMYDIPIDYKSLRDGQTQLTPRQEYQTRHSKAYKEGSIPEPPFDFAYGYAITCHKAQGSQWDKVLVIEEGFPFKPEEHSRWLYTAVTRAVEKCVVVMK